jgi:hypothetical protein
MQSLEYQDTPVDFHKEQIQKYCRDTRIEKNAAAHHLSSAKMYVWVKYFRDKTSFWWLMWIVLLHIKLNLEVTPFERSSRWPVDIKSTTLSQYQYHRRNLPLDKGCPFVQVFLHR